MFEPDPPPAEQGAWLDAVRPVVVAARFPLPKRAEAGQFIPVRVTFIGERAAGHAEAFWSALREAGADPNAGLGADRIPFDVLPPPVLEPTERRHSMTLPTDAGDLRDTVAWVRVMLTSPLSLMKGDGKQRRVNEEPTFGDLFRACQRTLGALGRCFGEPIPDGAFANLKFGGHGGADDSDGVRAVQPGEEVVAQRQPARAGGDPRRGDVRPDAVLAVAVAGVGRPPACGKRSRRRRRRLVCVDERVGRDDGRQYREPPGEKPGGSRRFWTQPSCCVLGAFRTITDRPTSSKDPWLKSSRSGHTSPPCNR